MIPIVPTIRAGVFAPILRWVSDHGLPVETFLRDAALGDSIAEDLEGFAPIMNGVEMLRLLGRAEGADVFCRIGATTDFSEVGAIGRIARSRRTPRGALLAVADFMPRHSTHEVFAVHDVPGGIRVIDKWTLAFDAEAQHFVHQYVAALVHSICAACSQQRPLFSRVEIVPHPTAGVDHLARWFGRVEAASEPRLVIDIPTRVADARADSVVYDDDRLLRGQPVVLSEVDFIASLRWTIQALMGAGAVSIKDVARAVNVTPRTLQRRLAEAGVPFSDLLDETRRDIALHLLGSSRLSIAEVAERLGYTNASALSRAVRRWTGQSPRHLRAQAHSDRGCKEKKIAIGGAER
ncbi:helix-turn-helix domain-containing protein [Stappia stellulata]|uniref:helix-turn-helix domain-containing protein n=1 Tax=Stappia stellulata TaxID=71235 RepID=UPI0003FF9A40|nr:helix-turn-helix transcriptional regulator [Stappia stellulata]